MSAAIASSPAILGPEGVHAKTGHALQTLANWRNLRNRGETVGPKFFKIGRLVRYFEADVDAWIAQQAESTTI